MFLKKYKSHEATRIRAALSLIIVLQWAFTEQDPLIKMPFKLNIHALQLSEMKHVPIGTGCIPLHDKETDIKPNICLFCTLLTPVDTTLLAEMSRTLKNGTECERCDLALHGDIKGIDVLNFDNKRQSIISGEFKTSASLSKQLVICSKRLNISKVAYNFLRDSFRALIFIICAILFLKEVPLCNRNTNTTHLKLERNSKANTYLSTEAKSILFNFRHPQFANFLAYPFSLNQYANDIVRDNKSGEELMKYEWSRYLSFKTFPMDSVMTPMRLAQAGFYSTGNGEEVKCFCCGMTNRDWTTDETAMEVHRRISPNCKYLIGDDETNIEIHAKPYYDDIFRTPSSTTNSRTQQSESGASGGPTDTNIQPQGGIHDRNSEHKREENGVKNPQTKPSIHTNTNTENSKTENGIHAGSASSNGVTSKQHVSINRAMKHPHYSTLESRVASYAGWPELDKQDPVELANAGFFYAGVKDFVRCFSCGVGLKNWERGDDPWHEHARWSKSCGHLLQSRGHEGQDDQPVGPERGEQSATEDSRMSNEGNNCNVPTTSTSNNAGPDMDTEATKALLEMGYDREAISEAIQTHHSTNGESNVSAEVILEILLNKDASPRESMNNASVTERSGPSASGSQVTESSGPSTSSSQVNKTPAKKSTPKGRKTDKTSGKKKSGEAQALSEENRSLREQMMCKICFDRDADVVFLPCGHMVSCQTCAVPLRKCAVCRKLIRGTVKVYQS